MSRTAAMTSTAVSVAVLLACASSFAGAEDERSSRNLRAGHSAEVLAPAIPHVSLLRTDDATASDSLLHYQDVDESFPPIPPFPKPVKDGVGFKRTISQLDDDTSFSLTFSGGQCTSKDEYGNNACHYNWGEAIEANYTVKLGEPLDKGVILQGHFRVDHVIPYSFSCSVCGEDCVLKVPVANLEWKFSTLPCPISTELIVDTIKEDLGNKSPTDGIPVHLEGDLYIVRASGDRVAQFSVSVDIK